MRRMKDNMKANLKLQKVDFGGNYQRRRSERRVYEEKK